MPILREGEKIGVDHHGDTEKTNFILRGFTRMNADYEPTALKSVFIFDVAEDKWDGSNTTETAGQGERVPQIYTDKN